MIHCSKRPSILLFASLTVLGLSSCTTARINHFKQFAKAGTQYVDVANAVTDGAGEAAIDADSLVLQKARAQLVSAREGTGDALKEQIKKESRVLADSIGRHNELLRTRLRILNDIQNHTLLLRSYFVALAALAESNEPSGIGQAAKGTVDALGKISDRIKKGKIGELPIGDFARPVTTIVVSQFQRAALEQELNARAVVIANELDLQKAALEVVARDMGDNLRLLQEEEERNSVLIPYSSASQPLPGNWASKRKEFLKKDIKLESAEAAAKAAERLKVSFIALAENRFDLADVEALLQDINRLVTLVEGVRGPPKMKAQ